MTGSVTVLGSLNMDFVVHVTSLPVAGETLHGHGFVMRPGGKGANQAVAAARLGAPVRLIGRVGADPMGATIVSRMREQRLDTSGISQEAALSTGSAMIIVATNGDNVIVVESGANAAVKKADVALATDTLTPNDVLILQFEVPAARDWEAIRAAKRRSATIILNAAPAHSVPSDQLPNIDVLVVNETEALPLLGRPVHSQQDAREWTKLAVRGGVRLAIVTMGAGGVVYSDGDSPRHLPASPATARDSTGAGDAFVGALSAALLFGLNTHQMVAVANVAAGIAVSRLGTQDAFPSRAELLGAYGQQCGDLEETRDVVTAFS